METNLFSDDVVIIIGAGASVPFGLPTGLGLIDLVANGLRDELKDLENLENQLERDRFLSYLELRKQIAKYAPAYVALNEIFEDKDWANFGNNFIPNAKAYLKETAEWIESQVSDSIDDLVRYNRPKARILKIGIVYEILKRTHDKDLTGFHSKNFQLRKIHQINSEGNLLYYDDEKPILLRNWIHNLINVVRNNFLKNWNSISDWKSSKSNNKIKIVTFNYDGILEEVLATNWASVESKLPNWRDIFEIVHPHGNITFTNFIGFENLPRYLFNNEKKIVVIHDNKVNKEVTGARDRAREMVDNARHIFSLGFAFAKPNCDLIGLHEKWANEDKSIHYLNFDNSFSLDTRVKRLNGDKLDGYNANSSRDADKTGSVGYSHKENGSHIYKMTPLKGDYLQITDALMGGFLGEMPS